MIIINHFFKASLWKMHGPGNSEEGEALASSCEEEKKKKKNLKLSKC